MEGLTSWLNRLLNSPLGEALWFLIVVLARLVIRSWRGSHPRGGSSTSYPTPET